MLSPLNHGRINVEIQLLWQAKKLATIIQQNCHHLCRKTREGYVPREPGNVLDLIVVPNLASDLDPITDFEQIVFSTEQSHALSIPDLYSAYT